MNVLVPFPTDIDLLNDVVEFSLSAVKDFLKMTGDRSVWNTPERWLQSEIARNIWEKHRLLAWLELGVDELLKMLKAEADPPLSLQGERKSGSLDIGLFEPQTPVTDSDFRGIVEIKTRVIRGTEFTDDAARIRDIGGLSSPLCGIVAGMFIGDSNRTKERVISGLRAQPDDVVCRPANEPDAFGTAYGAVGALVQRSSP